ncbi:MAG: hypothetical protein LCH30_11650 [Proteobacteria bacterium]|nr:hypothetical protein [Pseudomonadota bacterium]
MNEWLLIGAFGFLIFMALSFVIYPLWKARKLLSMLIPLFLVACFFSYKEWGAFNDWQGYLQKEERNKQVLAVLKTVKSKSELIDKLKMRLRQQPESAKGWYLLGRLYSSESDWLEAKNAFLKAHTLNPKSERMAVNYAQSLWQLNNQVFDEQVRTLFKEVLLKNPNQPDSLAMLAMDAFNNKDYEKAISYWQHLLKLMPAGSKESLMIKKAIAKAEERIIN